jgi:hypothetical protein
MPLTVGTCMPCRCPHKLYVKNASWSDHGKKRVLGIVDKHAWIGNWPIRGLARCSNEIRPKKRPDALLSDHARDHQEGQGGAVQEGGEGQVHRSVICVGASVALTVVYVDLGFKARDWAVTAFGLLVGTAIVWLVSAAG